MDQDLEMQAIAPVDESRHDGGRRFFYIQGDDSTTRILRAFAGFFKYILGTPSPGSLSRRLSLNSHLSLPALIIGDSSTVFGLYLSSFFRPGIGSH